MGFQNVFFSQAAFDWNQNPYSSLRYIFPECFHGISKCFFPPGNIWLKPKPLFSLKIHFPEYFQGISKCFFPRQLTSQRLPGSALKISWGRWIEFEQGGWSPRDDQLESRFSVENQLKSRFSDENQLVRPCPLIAWTNMREPVNSFQGPRSPQCSLCFLFINKHEFSIFSIINKLLRLDLLCRWNVPESLADI